MTEYWKGLLVDLPLDPSKSSEESELPTLAQLKKKILVKVKRASKHHVDIPGKAKPTTLQAPATLSRESTENKLSTVSTENTLSTVPTVESDSAEEFPDAANKPPAPKPKIIEALAKLGVYAGGYHFKGFDQPG